MVDDISRINNEEQTYDWQKRYHATVSVIQDAVFEFDDPKITFD